MDPHCFDADGNLEPDPDPAQNLEADPDPDQDAGGGGGRSAKNVHPPWQNPRYAPGHIQYKCDKNQLYSLINITGNLH